MPRRTRRIGRKYRELFLEAYADCGVIDAACKRSGMPRSSVFYLREHDEQFSFAFNQADAVCTERMEQEAHRRAVLGVEKPVYQGGQLVGTITEYSDGLLQFLLKARRPDKYKDRLALDVPAIVKTLVGVDVDAV